MVVNPTLCWSLIGEGNAIRKYLLDADAHYIAVDEIGQKFCCSEKYRRRLEYSILCAMN